jgi:hypothetical protein
MFCAYTITMKYSAIFCVSSLLAISFVNAQSLDGLKDQTPVTVHGGINARTMFYDASGIANRREPFTYILSGSAEIAFYGVSIPISFILSEQERSFRQPFNQYGLSPTYKWITLHGGYRNISFSPFTLDGYTMLGGGFELRPGKWHIGMMYGRLNRAITANQTSGDLQPISFSRKGIAGKIGYGTDTTNIMLTFVKAKDDPNSVAYEELDSVYVSPAENLAISLGGRVGLFKHFFIEAEGAASLYTKNIDSSVKLDTAEVDIPGSIASLMTINASSEMNTALRAGFGYRNKTFGLSLQYRRIDPNYQSMGAYFFQNDLENYTLNPSLIVWKQKIRVNGSLGIQRDNLSGQKQATARRTISSANVSANFTQRFGIDLAYSNYSTSQNPVAIKLNDSLRVAQTTHNFSFTPHYFITSDVHNHVLTFSLNNMKMNDHSLLSEQRNITAMNAFFNYQITFNKSGLSFFAGLNKTTLKNALRTSGNEGITVGGGKSFASNTINIRLTNSILKNRQGQATNMLYTHGVTGSYRVGKHHSFNLNMNYINNLGSVETQENGGYPKYTEFRGEVAYNLSF